MTASEALKITKNHFDSIYFGKGIDVSESDIEGWACIAFRQDPFISDHNIPHRIARRLAKRYPTRYNRITFICPVSIGGFVN